MVCEQVFRNIVRFGTGLFFAFFILFTIPSIAVAAENRENLIQREFECILRHTQNNLQWDDVCYKSEESLPDENGAPPMAIDHLEDPEAFEKYKKDLEEYRRFKNQSAIDAPAVSTSPPDTRWEDIPNVSAGSDDFIMEEKVGERGRYSDHMKKAIKAPAPTETDELNEFARVPVPDESALILRKNIYQPESKPIAFDWKVLGGYRRDKFLWNIASDITGIATPNILSELKWDPLKIAQVKTQATVTLMDRFVFDGKLAYGEIFEGENQDSDYLGDDRTLEFSRSNNNSEDDDVLDLTGGVGIKIPIGQYLEPTDEPFFFWVTPMAGYSYHEQNLRMTEGTQTIPATGSFAGLNSTYQTEWDGVWGGVQVDGAYKKWSGFFRFEYHYVDYYAEADWNLRSDFAHPKSYEHIADGRGLVYGGGLSYALNNRWRVNAEADFQDWETDPGLDRTFFSNGTVSETRLNEAIWESFGVTFGLTYSFF
jgi:hypothetical protein